jgi:ubiquinone/menaquinone biosynthesis C-methylase UbiE
LLRIYRSIYLPGLALLLAGCGGPCPSPAAPAAIPPALEEYMGRRIATTMHFAGAPWLIRDSREREEASSLMIGRLGLQPGQTVCDLGCGNGYHTLRIAARVGPTGRTLAVDIQPEMLKLLNQRAVEQGVQGIETIRGGLIDPRLPAGAVDLVLLVDVYHEFSHPVHMLQQIRSSLAPGGRMVLVEFRAEDKNVPIKPEHTMSREQILKEMRANGFKLTDEFNGLPWQHMMFFESAP